MGGGGIAKIHGRESRLRARRSEEEGEGEKEGENAFP
jgi:hypothetical protein